MASFKANTLTGSKVFQWRVMQLGIGMRGRTNLFSITMLPCLMRRGRMVVALDYEDYVYESDEDDSDIDDDDASIEEDEELSEVEYD